VIIKAPGKYFMDGANMVARTPSKVIKPHTAIYFRTSTVLYSIMSNQKKTKPLKEREMLEGAIKVFSKNGFDASSMDKTAETAGVSKITVYKHFQSKENLFLEIVSDFLRQSDGKNRSSTQKHVL
jgi:hypothetical protein